MKKTAAIYLFIVLNGTWALVAYILHEVGVRLAVIATLVAIGIALGNLTVYAGVKLAGRSLRRKQSLISN